MHPMAGAIVHDGHEAHDDGRAATVALWERGARRIAVPDHNPLQRIIRQKRYLLWDRLVLYDRRTRRSLLFYCMIAEPGGPCGYLYFTTAELGCPCDYTLQPPDSAVLVIVLYDRRTRRSL
jgi:hypothetical protein